MNNVVLDASALLALIDNEPGAAMVAEHLHRSIMSSVNVSEVAAVLDFAGFQEHEIATTLGNLVHNVEAFDYAQALQAGFLRKKTQSLGLSFGDRACIALAQQKNLPVMTADKAWQQLKEVSVVVIR